ncbi:hypothetical protein LOD99_11865 [Oopsacas minuta]|uniref:AB hydrolase-1 domain-containing protein n=1 Tax=Oopsacas minuta TaxID=111878 RepID=A0AAV7JKS6_9METZ|nr:hypothetical protein LOD99_11865 [Oopsacas minuta]
MLDRIYICCYSTFRVIYVLIILFLNYITNPSDWFCKKSHKPVTPSPTCLIDSIYGEHVYITINGIQLHYVISGPEGAPVMLMLHGFMEFWYSWRYQIKEFSKKYRVVALDLPGYGYSEKPTSGKFYTMLYLTDTIIGLVNAISSNRCIIIGQSLGAAIAWNVVRTRPESFSHLIIVNGPDASRINISNLSLETQIKFCRAKGLIHQENFSKEDMDAHLAIFKQDNALTPIFNYYRFNKLDNYVVNRAKITNKTLVLWSAFDDVLTPELADECTTVLEDYKFEYLQCSHFVQQDMPKEVNTMIKNFLDV